MIFLRQSSMEEKVIDYLIIGAGLAGLNSAIKIKERYPEASVAIAEEYSGAGGRVVTYRAPSEFGEKIHWENGAGRIHSSHTNVMKYIEKYKLLTYPIQSKELWISEKSLVPEPNIWESLSSIIVSALSSLKPHVLANNSVEEILLQTYGEEADILLKHFAYRAEIQTLRADLALESLQREMGLRNNTFFGVKDGMGRLIKSMRNDLENMGVIFFFDHKCKSYTLDHKISKKVITVSFSKGKELRTRNLILAIHSEGLKGIAPIKNLPYLEYLSMKPLLRTYAIFPYSTKSGAWFSGLNKIVTDSKLRFIIPISNGTIMTSYTDNDDTKYWVSILQKEGEEGLCKKIMTELRHLFEGKERKIPDPLFFKSHYWSAGCTYWLPGSYNPKEISDAFMKPFADDNVFICGESYSLKQAWMEGALIHSNKMLEKYIL